jgi:hypothetical protein
MGCCLSANIVPIYAESGPNTKLISLEDQPDLIDLPLHNVSIMSSHNTYIRTLQHIGESSLDALRIVLDRGARCIELDIYRDLDTNNIFVAHGKENIPRDIITTTCLPLEDALKFIMSYAFIRTNDPLFIALEMNVHNERIACDNVANILERYIDGRLYRGHLTGNTILRDLLGKVVLMTGGGVNSERLSNMIHTQWNEVFQNVASNVVPESLNGNETCIRVYPDGDLRGALSMNFDPLPFLRAGATFVALNMCTNDNNMRAYIEWFSKSSIMKKPL